MQAGSWADTFDRLQPPPGSAIEQAKYWKFSSQFITEPFPAEAIDIVGEFAKRAPTELSDYFCSSFGGAVKMAPPGGSAFAHRDAIFYYQRVAAGQNGLWRDSAKMPSSRSPGKNHYQVGPT